MKTYTLCGSMRFEKEMKEIAYYLETQKGYSILQCIYVKGGNEPTPEELQKLELAHYHKIDTSDGIYVFLYAFIIRLQGFLVKKIECTFLYTKACCYGKI